MSTSFHGNLLFVTLANIKNYLFQMISYYPNLFIFEEDKFDYGHISRKKN